MPLQNSRSSKADAEVLKAWARLGNRDELKRICKDILGRPRQGYSIATEAQHIIRAHVEHWRLDAPVEAEVARKNRSLLKTGPKVMRRLDDALRDIIDLHRQAETRAHWYGKSIVTGEVKGPAARSWARFPKLYERVRKSLYNDPLWLTLHDTPRDMWLIPPRGNPKKRRNGVLIKALRRIGLTKMQVDDVIHALGWRAR